MNNPPTLNPGGDNDCIEYVTEGFNITLTCTRDSNNAPGDLYQWIHPNGQITPGAPADSPVEIKLNGITIEESGIYICQGSRNGVTDFALQSNLTLIVQRELHILSNILKTYYGCNNFNFYAHYINYRKSTYQYLFCIYIGSYDIVRGRPAFNPYPTQ